MIFDTYVIKAFTNNSLEGNPAAVIFINEIIKKEMMQKIAKINSFPETVFLFKDNSPSRYRIWWFTPTTEVYDAGHATLAAQYVLFKHVHKNDSAEYIELFWEFGTKLVSRKTPNRLEYKKENNINSISFNNNSYFKKYNGKSFECFDDVFIVLDNVNQVINYKPNLYEISKTKYRGLAVTSKGNSEFDYCCRFFAPRYGVDEDNTTATAHKYLSLFWSKELGLESITGFQLSGSNGIVKSVLSEKNIYLYGDCCIYSKGKIFI